MKTQKLIGGVKTKNNLDYSFSLSCKKIYL